ncbi:hypothetical protein EBR04_02070 [bacterium]|nr:hypothetical protein [bacterium]
MLAIRNQAALPRARIVRRVVRVEPVARGDCRGRERLLRSIAFPSPELPDLFHAAVVELPGAAPLPAGVVSGSTADNAEDASADACRVVHDGPQRVVVEARLERPGLLVLADTFTPDWSAVVSTEGGEPRPAQILRANHIHRGVPLPAGASAVEFRYRSRSFAWSAAVTLAAWGVWAIAAVLSGLRPCRRGRT